MQTAVIMVAVLGGVFGLILAIAGRKFAVEVDPRIDEITALLPGANCGSCGFAGCGNMAEAIVSGDAPDASKCAACSAENKNAINAIMGHAASESDGPVIRYIARLSCNGCKANRTPVTDYHGLNDCHVKAKSFSGPGQCNFGCLGCGSCVKACSFGAITISPNGLPVFDYNKCVGCGACAAQCPQMVIEIVDAAKKVFLQCNNREKGKAAMTNCKVSCISCGMCVKNCPKEAITLEDGPNGSLPVIDYDKCVGCGICVSKCPRKCLVKVAPVTGTPEAPAEPAATGCAACAMKENCPSAQ